MRGPPTRIVVTGGLLLVSGYFRGEVVMELGGK